jgi:copper(I)-binding protein|tara:strand:- start:923 stop:1357 length:435 start_codon:yes stop_codon:yes gene_type:complete
MKRLNLLLLLLLISFNNYAADIKFTSATVKSPRAGMNISAGFFSVSSNFDLLIKSIKSDLIGRIEIHSMKIIKTSDGLEIMKMRKIESPKIIKGVPFILKPGGNHLMLYGIDQKISATNELVLSFTLETNSGDLITKDILFKVN